MNCHVLTYASKLRNCRWLSTLSFRSKISRTTISRSHLRIMTASAVRSNHLKNERSPYLLQHANNPVNWFPWGDDAIKQARSQNKLIFLSVGYSTCHWCHVMERESFENESVAAIMNEYFVNIKVDREERPDVDKTYMTFVQLTSGSGGWPMSVFLTPDLNPVAGGTYFPPEDKWGRAGFKTVLLKIAKQWKENPEDLRQTGHKVVDLLRKASTFDLNIVGELTKGSAPELECAKVCVHQLSRNFDEEFGGFAIAPKFAMPTNLMLLFHFYTRNKQDAQSKSALAMALKTLEMMNKGGIHDHIGQGFARYSTDEKWQVPHFEKMLYDQGQLAVAYATAFLITKKSLFGDILRDILTYVHRDLSHEKGGFYSAEDADSLPAEGDVVKKEGAFYVWKFDEIEALLDRPLKVNENVRLSQVFNHHYNVRQNGNVEAQNDPHGELIDRNVLIVLGSEEETAEKFSISVTDLKDELNTAREILFNERNKRPRPHLDSKIITSWNGLMLSGFSKAAQVLHDPAFIARATKAANFIKEHLWQSIAQELLHCCYMDDNRENIVQIPQPIQGFLNDYVFLIRGLLDLYECTYDASLIEWCDKLQATQDRLFWDESDKAYNMANGDEHSVLLTLKDDQDGVEPAGNSVAVQNLLRLSTLLQRDEYLVKAKHVLSAFTSRLNRLPSSLPEMVSSLMFFHDSSVQIFVVENNDSANAREMLSAAHDYYIPNRVLALVDGDENSILHRESELIRNMKGRGKSATAYVCRNGTCSEPVTTVEELIASLSEP